MAGDIHTAKNMDFFMLIGRLKGLQRTGWVKRGVKEPESVASHMYRMAVISMFADSKAGIDKDRCVKLSLIHDMAECIVGDITPSDGISKEEKHSQELAAMKTLLGLVNPEVGREIKELWEEYEHQSTPEARFVKDVDRFDMVLQAFEYEQSDKRPGQLQDFFDSTKDKFQTDQVKEWVQQLYKMRNPTLPKEDKDS